MSQLLCHPQRTFSCSHLHMWPACCSGPALSPGTGRVSVPHFGAGGPSQGSRLGGSSVRGLGSNGSPLSGQVPPIQGPPLPQGRSTSPRVEGESAGQVPQSAAPTAVMGVARGPLHRTSSDTARCWKEMGFLLSSPAQQALLQTGLCHLPPAVGDGGRLMGAELSRGEDSSSLGPSSAIPHPLQSGPSESKSRGEFPSWLSG